MSRMDLLKQASGLVTQYTREGNWRPGLIDLLVYDIMTGMHESDYDNGTDTPDYIWRKSPDEIMDHIITNTGLIFDVEYGLEDLDEQIRNYLIMNDYIADPLDIESVTDQELEDNLTNAPDMA